MATLCSGNVNQCNPAGESAVLRALENGKAAVVRYLASVPTCELPDSAIRVAICNVADNEQVLDALLSRWTTLDVNAVFDGGSNMLHLAAQVGNTQVVAYLLRVVPREYVRARNKLRQTPEAVARAHVFTATADLLRDAVREPLPALVGWC